MKVADLQTNLDYFQVQVANIWPSHRVQAEANPSTHCALCHAAPVHFLTAEFLTRSF